MAGCELDDRSSRPHHSPRAVAGWLEDAIVHARKQRPRWGPRKLGQAMLRANPKADLPSVSTFALIIRRNGLVRPRRRRRCTPEHSAPLAHALTITDAFSRYLVACVALSRPDGRQVRRAMEPRTLAELEREPAEHARAPQRVFDHFRYAYNYERRQGPRWPPGRQAWIHPLGPTARVHLDRPRRRDVAGPEAPLYRSLDGALAAVSPLARARPRDLAVAAGPPTRSRGPSARTGCQGSSANEASGITESVHGVAW